MVQKKNSKKPEKKKTPIKKASAKKKAPSKKKSEAKNPKKVKPYTNVGFDLIPEQENSENQLNTPDDSVLKEINGRTLLTFKQNEKTGINFSIIIHGIALLLIIFLTASGVATSIKGFLAVYKKGIFVKTSFILPISFTFLSIGFFLGFRTWNKRCKNLFKKSAFITFVLFIFSLCCALFPDMINFVGIKLVSLFTDAPKNFLSQLILTVPFIMVYMILLGYLVSLFIPALSVLDIWYREKLRLKNFFVFPPKVRKWLSTWVIMAFAVFCFAFYMVFSILTRIFDNMIFDQGVWFILSCIFLFTGIFGNLIYLIYKPRDFDAIADSSISLERTSVGFKIFGSKSRTLSLLAALFGLIGITFFIIISMKSIGKIENIFQNDSYLVLIFVLPALCTGFFISVLLLRFFTPRLIILTSVPILFLIEIGFRGFFTSEFVLNYSINEFGFLFFLVLRFFIGSIIFAAILRSIRVMFEANIFDEGRLISKVICGAFIIASVESMILLIYITDPILLLQISFIGFIGCIVLFIIVSPAGAWYAREEIYKNGETFVEKKKSKLSVVLAIAWSLIIIASTVLLAEFQKPTLDIAQTAQIEDKLEFYDDYVIRITMDKFDDYWTQKYNGETQVIQEAQPDYSIIGTYIGMLSHKTDFSKTAILSNSPNKYTQVIDNLNIKNPLFVTDYYAKDLTKSINHKFISITSPVYWLNSDVEKTDFFLYEVSPLSEKFSTFRLIINGLGKKLDTNGSGVIAININLLNSDFIDNIISVASEVFKNSEMYYLPDRILIFTEKTTLAKGQLGNFTWGGKFNVPDTTKQLFAEFQYWKLRNYKDKLNNIELKFTNAKIAAKDKLKFENLKYILARYVNSDSLAEKVLKSQISFIIQNYEKSRELIEEAKVLYESLIIDNNKPEFNKTPIRTIYNRIYAKVFYMRALKSYEKAIDSNDYNEKKNGFVDAIMFLNNSLDYKKNDLDALVLAVEVAKKQGKFKLANTYLNKIQKLYPGFLSK